MQSTSERPERLFRYLSPYHSGIFAEKKLWFSAVNEFNDVFDVCPRFDVLIPDLVDEQYKAVFGAAGSKTSYQEFIRTRETERTQLINDKIVTAPEALQALFSKQFGIVCFCETLNSLLMWSHYAASHKGFVVEFNPQHDLFRPRNFQKVTYSIERPIATRNANVAMLLHKGSEWQYEREHRLIVHTSELLKQNQKRHGIDVARHFIPLPMEAVKAVYFGCEISDEDRIRLFEPLIEFPDIALYSMRKHKTEYKLDVMPILRAPS